MKCPCCGATAPDIPRSEVVANALPPVQAAVLRALAANFGRFIATERLTQIVWANDPHGGPEYAKTCISAAIARMRPKLVAHSLAVDAKQYLGYRVRAA